MYVFLVSLHSICRWLILVTLLYAIGRAYSGYKSQRDCSDYDDQVRKWTVRIAHIQLIIGMILYIKSPLISYFWKNTDTSLQHIEIAFYGFLHPLLMLVAVVMITIGSSLAKRKEESTAKYRTLLFWFSVALLIIFLAIPWPFSFFSQRPYIREF